MTAQHQFGYSFIIIAIVHGILIFGINFQTEKIPLSARNLDVILLNDPQISAQTKLADFISQASQQGGGDDKKTNRFEDQEQQIANRETVPARQQSLNMQGLLPQYQEGPPLQQTPIEREMTRIATKLQRKQQQYAKKLQHKVINASTQESKYAEYLDQWRKKVEKIGNRYYPKAASQQDIFGSVLLQVAIKSNGQIKLIKIIKSSGHQILDRAAFNIIKKAAPFAPFSQSLRQEIDILDIYRTLIFKKGDQINTK